MVVCKKLVGVVTVLTVISVFGLVSCDLRMAGSNRAVPSDVLEWRLGEFTESPPSGLSTTGNPKIVDCPYGKAMKFDGKGDAFFVDANPLQGLRSFTVEVIMRPDAGGPKEQRFFHIGSSDGDRMLIETRLTDNDEWYLDTYLKSGQSDKALLDAKLLHPVGKWYHLALVVDKGRMQNYVNGKAELNGEMDLSPINTGTTSIGVRLNRVFWFKGAIYKIRITPRVLKRKEFTTR